MLQFVMLLLLTLLYCLPVFSVETTGDFSHGSALYASYVQSTAETNDYQVSSDLTAFTSGDDFTFYSPVKTEFFLKQNRNNFFSLEQKSFYKGLGVVSKYHVYASYPALYLSFNTNKSYLAYFLGHEVGHAKLDHLNELFCHPLEELRKKVYGFAGFCGFFREIEADMYGALGLKNTNIGPNAFLFKCVADVLYDLFDADEANEPASGDKTKREIILELVLQVLKDCDYLFSGEALSPTDEVVSMIENAVAKAYSARRTFWHKYPFRLYGKLKELLGGSLGSFKPEKNRSPLAAAVADYPPNGDRVQLLYLFHMVASGQQASALYKMRPTSPHGCSIVSIKRDAQADNRLTVEVASSFALNNGKSYRRVCTLVQGETISSSISHAVIYPEPAGSASFSQAQSS